MHLLYSISMLLYSFVVKDASDYTKNKFKFLTGKSPVFLLDYE